MTGEMRLTVPWASTLASPLGLGEVDDSWHGSEAGRGGRWFAPRYTFALGREDVGVGMVAN
jgi:hypothetical protein